MYHIIYFYFYFFYHIQYVFIQKFVLKVAKLLKDSIKQNESKTINEIIKILEKSNPEKNKYDNNELCQELIKYKILLVETAKSAKSEGKTDENNVYYSFNKSMYDKLKMKQENGENNSNNISNIHINENRSWGDGIPVRVFSPKSQKWRDAIVLEYDSETSIGRICCYNNMGKQSIKELSLPNKFVQPKTTEIYHHHHHHHTNIHRHHTSNIHRHTQQQQQQQYDFVDTDKMTAETWNKKYGSNNNIQQ